MVRPKIAMDFGSFASKVAWRDDRGMMGTLTFGSRPSLRTLFFLPEGSREILVGDDAQEAAEDEPVRAVRDLKRHIVGHRSVRTTQDRPVEPQELLDATFACIGQEMAAQLGAGFESCDLALSMPAASSVSLQSALRQAAATAGFGDGGTSRQEPALVRFAAAAGDVDLATQRTVVTLDCGAGGTRWSAVECGASAPPRALGGGEADVGGADLDGALVDWLQDAAPSLCAVRPEARLQDQVRRWKEVALEANVPVFRISGRSTGLDRSVLLRLHDDVILATVRGAFARFLETQRRGDAPVVVLVAGGASSGSVLATIEALGARSVACPDDAYVRGALSLDTGGESLAPPVAAVAPSWEPPQWRGEPAGAPSMLDAFDRKPGR